MSETGQFTTTDYWKVGYAIRRHGAAEGTGRVPVSFNIPLGMLPGGKDE